MARNTPVRRWKLIWLPRKPDGKPAENACRHLAELDEAGRIVRFHRQTAANLLAAEDGEDALRAKRSARSVLRFIRRMKAMGFYRS